VGGFLMKTIAYTLELKDDPELIKKYVKHHKKVWPEVLRGIQKSGVKHSKIFLLGNRLFLIMQADDSYDAEMLQSYVQDPKEKEWDELMRTFQQPVKEAKKEEWWAEMDMVFDYEQQIALLDLESEKIGENCI